MAKKLKKETAAKNNSKSLSNIKTTDNKSQLDFKYSSLKAEIKSYGSLAVAFSGGVDSSFLLKIASELLGDRVIAVTLKSATFPQREIDRAIEFAASHKIKHIIIDEDATCYPAFIKNDRNRCYYCKHAGFKKIIEIAAQNGFNNVADGANQDDVADYRPGTKAAEELGVLSPLKKHGFTKEEIRKISKDLGLAGWDRPSFACLASRIPYGTRITESLLLKIDKLESFLLEKGLNQVRVRHHGDIARIEVAKEDFSTLLEKNLMPGIVTEFKRSGYLYATLDLEGYNAGSMNRTITEGS